MRSYVFHVVFLCFVACLDMFAYGFLMFSCVFPMVFFHLLRFPYHFLMFSYVFLCIFYGFPIYSYVDPTILLCFLVLFTWCS